jgi:hypothetical protein
LSLTGFGKVFNGANELLAEGRCDIDLEHGTATLHPLIDQPSLTRQQGALRLVLDDGYEYALSDRVIRFRLNVPGVPPGPAYRLYFTSEERRRQAEGGER